MYTMLTCTNLICPAFAACAELELELTLTPRCTGVDLAAARSLRSRWEPGAELC